MPYRHFLFIVILFLALVLAINSGSPEIFAVQIPAVHTNPTEVTGISMGDIFTVNVSVANISGLAGWEFRLYYSSQVLRAINYSEGPFLKSLGSTIFVDTSDYEVMGIYNEYNATHGRVWLACGLLGGGSASGSGTLARVSFQAKGPGSTVLAWGNSTKLTTSGAAPITHTTIDGRVTVIGHDVAVTNIQLSKTVVSDAKVTINVTAANLGTYPASFNVTVYHDSTEIATQTVTDLAGETSRILTFIWDTATIPKGNYTISAYAPPLVGESNTENNRLTGGWIVEAMLGDINGDGKVNIIDISMVAKAWQTKPGDAKWDPNADVDDSGLINIMDISKVAKEFGKMDP